MAQLATIVENDTFVRNEINLAVWQALATTNGREVIDDDDFVE